MGGCTVVEAKIEEEGERKEFSEGGKRRDKCPAERKIENWGIMKN